MTANCQPTEHSVPPTTSNHAILKPFNFLRTFFSLAVLQFHCVLFYNGFKADPISSSWASFSRNRLFVPIFLSGLNAVPIFFTISSFLLTLRLIRALEARRAQPLAALLLSRYLRLATFLIPRLAIGLAWDGAFYTASGGLEWVKVLGYLGMFGNLLPSHLVGTWMVDMVMIPCWSLVLDFQGSAILILLVPLIHRLVGLQKWPLYLALFTGITARFHVVNHGWPCDSVIPESALSPFHPNSLFLIASPTATVAVERMQRTAIIDYPLALGGCSFPASDISYSYYPRLYTALASRITPFFVGAIMAFNFDGAAKPGSHSGMSKAVSWLCFLPSVLYLTAPLAPVDTDYLPPPAVQVFVSVFNHTLLSLAVAFVTFCAIVPETHPCHAPVLANFMGADLWSTPAKYSLWMYALHCPVLFFIISATDLPVGYGTGLAVTIATIFVTAPLGLFCHYYVELPVEAFRKKAVPLLADFLRRRLALGTLKSFGHCSRG